MAIPLFHAGCFQPIGGRQMSFAGRTWPENRVQAVYAEDSNRLKPCGPYMILVSGPTEMVKAIERVLAPAVHSQCDMMYRNTCWDFKYPEDAKAAYKMLVSLESVNVWLFVKSAQAHEFGDTFLKRVG